MKTLEVAGGVVSQARLFHCLKSTGALPHTATKKSMNRVLFFLVKDKRVLRTMDQEARTPEFCLAPVSREGGGGGGGETPAYDMIGLCPEDMLTQPLDIYAVLDIIRDQLPKCSIRTDRHAVPGVIRREFHIDQHHFRINAFNGEDDALTDEIMCDLKTRLGLVGWSHVYEDNYLGTLVLVYDHPVI